MITNYCLISGPDASHLQDNSWFSRLKDAQEAARLLPASPTGQKRPYIIEAHDYEKSTSLYSTRIRTVANTTKGWNHS